MMQKEPVKYCLICGKEIFRSKNKRNTHKRRGVNAVTCSHNCSIIYIRKYRHKVNV